MHKNTLDQLERFISQINKAQNQNQVIEILQKQINVMGFDKMTYWLRWHSQETKKPILLSTYPGVFLEHYVANDFQSHDMVGRFSNEKSTPFKWTDIGKQLPITKIQKILFSDCSSVGLRSGGSIPLHGPKNVKATFSVANDLPEEKFNSLFEYHRHTLHLLATYAHEKIINLGINRTEKPLKLTSREAEILTWAARGKSYWEISTFLNIQEDTIKKHAQNICMRLGVVNLKQAISRGIIDGIILP